MKVVLKLRADGAGMAIFAVELAVIENILAAVCEVDRQELKRLRGQCVEEIKRTNGMISFEQALQWQKE